MKIKAQIGMVLNLDKCIGCHTCSVTCKNTWTNRPGAEYMWFNNVETKPGVGYPKRWEDEDHYKGGWELNSKGKLQLRAGNKVNKIALGKIFINLICQNWTTIMNHGRMITKPYSDLKRPINQLHARRRRLLD